MGIVKSRLKKMNCSAAPVQLHVGLAYVCRVHGLTPHSSTSRCPYELIRDGPTPSLFPQLTAGSTDKSEQTAIRHSVGRMKKITFAEEEVIVYDLRSKLSARGKVLEVLGNNTYLVDCGKGPQHISGDVISKVSSVASRSMGKTDGDQMQTAEVVEALEPEDVEPVSDSSSESEAEHNDVIQVAAPRRRRRVRAEHLGPVVQHRLRQRR